MTHQNKTRRYGFTLIEILVVIAIIAVLAGILLAALSGVQQAAKKTKTTTLMQSFGRACDEFALDHGRYPGLLPDAVIDGTRITSTQNALLELMGGARVIGPQSTTQTTAEYNDFLSNTTVPAIEDINGWSLAFNPNRFGEGPWVSGRVYEPYFSPKSSDLKYKVFDVAAPDDFELPALVDAWETPIIYLRAVRKNGPIIDDPANNTLPQFELPNMDQFFSGTLNSTQSLIATDSEDRVTWLTMLLAHPTFWEQSSSWDSNSAYSVAWCPTRGRFLLLSAGPDTIYLETTNTPTNPENNDLPYTTQELKDASNIMVNPSIMDTFDDVVVHGG
jgi:prepilin-type N-terminal cleavage/methylation domain-containing protein